MEDREKYSILEFGITFLSIVLVMFLFGRTLSLYFKSVVLTGIACGFYVSIFKNDLDELLKPFMNLAAVGISVWMGYSLYNSSFHYLEIILILARSIFLVEVVLSFYASQPKFLGYIQGSLVCLFMCFPLFLKDYDPISISEILGVFICWLIFLRLRFYSLFGVPISQVKFKKNYTVILLIVIFVVSLFSAGLVFYKYPLKSTLKPGGFLSAEFGLGDAPEKEYAALQDQVQKRLTDSILGLESTDDSHAALDLLDYLLRDSSTIQEVRNAQQGLISRLKTPGPGMEEAEGNEITRLLDDYVAKKSEYNQKKTKEDILNLLKSNPLQIKERLGLPGLIDKIIESSSSQAVSGYAQEARQMVEYSSFDDQTKQSLEQLINKLEEWRNFQIQGLEPKPLEETLEQPKPEQKPPVPVEPEKSVPAAAMTSAGLFNNLFLALILFVFTGIITLLLVSYFSAASKARQILLLHNNPKAFISKLYENLKEVLFLFGSKRKGHIAPIPYAEEIRKSYNIKKDDLMNLTVKFEEARYSSHSLSLNDANRALEDYNNVLKEISSRYNRFTVFLKRLLFVLHGRPFFIY